MVDGELLDRTVAAAEVQDAAPVKKPKAKKSKANNNEGRDMAEGAAAGAAVSKNDSLLSSTPFQSSGGGVLTPAVAAVAPKSIEKDGQGKRALPDDAMLILSPNLYFTRSQMLAVGVLLSGVVTAARIV